MVIIHLDNGTTVHLDVRREGDVRALDNPNIHKRVRRAAIIDDDGKRIDLPLNRKQKYQMWMEPVMKCDEIKGERLCMRSDFLLLSITLYYSDKRVVFDLDHSGGFRCFRHETYR